MPPRLLSAFSSRNYRLYFTGQAISLLGNWMTQTASLWLVYHLSSSPFQLGLVGFAGQFPIFLFGALAGVVADRVNRHKLLVWTQVLSMVQSLTLAGFAFTDSITVTWLVILMFVQGMVNAFDMPARQTMVVEFVERKEHLGNAIALNSSLFNLTRLAGPTIGGVVIALFGGGTRGSAWCYLIDGISYGATIVALLMMRLPPRPLKVERRRAHTEFREGLHYVMGSPPIRTLIVLVAAVGAIGFFYMVMTPVFAKDIFHGDAKTQGWMMSGAGAGAVLGSLYLGTRRTVHGLGNVITFGGLAMAAGLVGFGLSRLFPLSLLCLGLCGMGGVLLMASANTLIQTMVHDDKRGRVMSLFTMSVMGTLPLGNLLAGSMAAKFGPTPTLIFSGAGCAVIAVFFYWELPKLRAAAAPLLATVDPATLDPVPMPIGKENR